MTGPNGGRSTEDLRRRPRSMRMPIAPQLRRLRLEPRPRPGTPASVIASMTTNRFGVFLGPVCWTPSVTTNSRRSTCLWLLDKARCLGLASRQPLSGSPIRPASALWEGVPTRLRLSTAGRPRQVPTCTSAQVQPRRPHIRVVVIFFAVVFFIISVGLRRFLLNGTVTSIRSSILWTASLTPFASSGWQRLYEASGRWYTPFSVTDDLMALQQVDCHCMKGLPQRLVVEGLTLPRASCFVVRDTDMLLERCFCEPVSLGGSPPSTRRQLRHSG